MSSSYLHQTNWPDAAPLDGEDLIFSISCGNTHLHWATHYGDDEDYNPQIFWRCVYWCVLYYIIFSSKSQSISYNLHYSSIVTLAQPPKILWLSEIELIIDLSIIHNVSNYVVYKWCLDRLHLYCLCCTFVLPLFPLMCRPLFPNSLLMCLGLWIQFMSTPTGGPPYPKYHRIPQKSIVWPVSSQHDPWVPNVTNGVWIVTQWRVSHRVT